MHKLGEAGGCSHNERSRCGSSSISEELITRDTFAIPHSPESQT